MCCQVGLRLEGEKGSHQMEDNTVPFPACPPSLLTVCASSVQVGAGDMDGFQADTEEEEEEEDGDCMIVDIPDVDGENGSSPAAWGGREE